MTQLALIATPARAVWYFSRGAGAVALLGLTATVALGIMDVRRWCSARWPRFVLDALHRDVALVTLAVLAGHVATAVIDSYAPIAVADAVLPFVSRYRPVWLGLGALALDVLLAVVLTSLLRRRLGYRAWRGVHWAAYACWPLALVHGLGTGSDVRSGWLPALAAACALTVAAAVAWRVRAGARPATAAALAAAVVAVAAWVLTGPLRPGWAGRAGTPAADLASAGTEPTGGVPPRFTARLQGRVLERLSAGGTRASLDLPLVLHGGPGGTLRVRVRGRVVPGGGVTLGASRVTLGGGYRGRVTGLAGSRVDALVRAPDGRALRLALVLQLHPGSRRVSGTLAAEPV